MAVSGGAGATPLPSVDAVTLGSPPKLAVAPPPGAVNVTVTSGTGMPFASTTVACNAVANAVSTTVLCGVPAVAVTLAGPGVMRPKTLSTLSNDARYTLPFAMVGGDHFAQLPE